MMAEVSPTLVTSEERTQAMAVEEVRRDYGNGMRYKGEARVEDGVFEGKGTLWVLFSGPRPGSTWGGWVYSGEWKNGKKEGHGTMKSLPPNCTFADGADGVVVSNAGGGVTAMAAVAGNGEQTWEEGTYSAYEYSGGWKGDKMDGMGTEKTAAGEYTGSWRGGLRHGFGTFLHRYTGDKYVGQWKDGLEHGEGKEVAGGSGDVQEGTWVAGLLHGFGRQVERGGNVLYEGQWVEGVREGRGRLLVRRQPEEVMVEEDSGSGEEEETVSEKTATLVYDGEWKADRWNGAGTLTTAKLHYEGQFVEGKKHGKGCQTRDTCRYHGDWVRGKMHGQGTFHDSASGDSYTGGWLDGRRSGAGALTVLRDGQRVRISGHWLEGELVHAAAEEVLDAVAAEEVLDPAA